MGSTESKPAANSVFCLGDKGDREEKTPRIDVHWCGGVMAQVFDEIMKMKEGRYPCQLAKSG